MTPQAATIIDRLDQLRDRWCVYEHWLFNDTHQCDVLVYMGLCKLSQVFGMPDAHRNSEWGKLVTPATVLTIKITATGTHVECANQRGRNLLALTARPHCNQLGFDMTGTSARIVCNETGQEFSTQAECAEAQGISQGNLSLHLAGKLRKVGGLTYRRE